MCPLGGLPRRHDGLGFVDHLEREPVFAALAPLVAARTAVAVDQERWGGLLEEGGEMDGGGGLADAAFLYEATVTIMA